jgi:dihydroorotate dehydrogenase (fumarate)
MYILCGATAVQIGTHLIQHGPSAFNRLEKEFIAIMIEKGYTSINQFKGQLSIHPPIPITSTITSKL